MARRIVFRDPSTGRFISAERAAEVGGSVTTYGDAPQDTITADYFDWADQQLEPGDDYDYNIWSVETTDRGWIATPGADDADLYGLEMPPGATSFRVFVNVEDNPDYPRGWASTGWHGVASWPPEAGMVKGVSATGFNHIRFS